MSEGNIIPCMKNVDYQYRSYLAISNAISILSLRFDNVSIPIRNNFFYDLIVEKNFEVFRVKVIYTNCKQPSGHYVANIRKSGGYVAKKESKSPFDPKFCDYLYVESPVDLYLIPSSRIMNIKSITLSQFQDCRISSAVEHLTVNQGVPGSIPGFDV